VEPVGARVCKRACRLVRARRSGTNRIVCLIVAAPGAEAGKRTSNSAGRDLCGGWRQSSPSARYRWSGRCRRIGSLPSSGTNKRIPTGWRHAKPKASVEVKQKGALSPIPRARMGLLAPVR
jgi:hypothetical protein